MGTGKVLDIIWWKLNHEQLKTPAARTYSVGYDFLNASLCHSNKCSSLPLRGGLSYMDACCNVSRIWPEFTLWGVLCWSPLVRILLCFSKPSYTYGIARKGGLLSQWQASWGWKGWSGLWVCQYTFGPEPRKAKRRPQATQSLEWDQESRKASGRSRSQW